MIKVGIVGTGFMARTHAQAYQQLKNVEISGFHAVNEEKGKGVAAEFHTVYYANYAAMLEQKDIDIIDICAPTFAHEELVIAAAKAGKHILCEKPIALTMEAIDRMLAATRQAGVHFMIAHVLRFWPEYRKISDILADGLIGQVHSVSASRLAQAPNWNDWFQQPDLSGGALFDLHLHDIDFLHHLFGAAEKVYAQGKRTKSGSWNHVMSSLAYANGIHVNVEASTIMPNDYPFSTSLRIVGDGGAIDYTFRAGFNIEDLDASEQSFKLYVQDREPVDIEIEQGNAFVNQLAYFVKCVQNNEPPNLNLPTESREVMQTIIDLERSLENRTEI